MIFLKKSKKFYPTTCLKETLKHQWKEKVNVGTGSWKELFDLAKNLKMRYRVSTDDVVFRKFKTEKSFVLSYINDLKYLSC
jgi:hypothetical protein